MLEHQTCASVALSRDGRIDKTQHTAGFCFLDRTQRVGDYIVNVSVLNGLAAEGDTLQKATAMAREAIKGYVEALQKNNLRIPDDIRELCPLIEKLPVAF